MEPNQLTTPTLLGKLLVAAPDIGNPIFDHAMVFVIEHSAEGAIGLVVNQPTLTPVDELAPEWDHLASQPGVIFGGGPVDHDALITLGRGTTPGELAAGLHSIDLDEQPDMIQSNGVDEIRIFSGYAGWLEGQLEQEVMYDAWWIFEPRIDDIFSPDPAAIWSEVLKRQTAPYNWYAHFPDSVRAN